MITREGVRSKYRSFICLKDLIAIRKNNFFDLFDHDQKVDLFDNKDKYIH